MLDIMTGETLEVKIWAILALIKDPEIPAISIEEMGMIHSVIIHDNEVTVEMKPTFVGCPAIEMMKQAIVKQISLLEGVEKIDVRFIYEPAWSSNDISEDGRAKLKKFGIACPPLGHTLGDTWNVDCPYCSSPYTTMDNVFGPTACRSILYCKHCKNPFEAIKP